MGNRRKKNSDNGGEARVRRAMELVERDHRRRRRNVMVAAAIGSALVLIAVAAISISLGSASALSREAKPPIVAAAVPGPITGPSSTGTPAKAADTAAGSGQKAGAAQKLSIGIGDVGYEPAVVQASSGRPITLTVGRGEGCAAGFLMPELGITKDNTTGPVTFDLGRLKSGTYRFTCGMGMIEGKLVVS